MSSPSSPSSLRIIGGKWRSRRISFPAISGLRPTGDRIRETLFNWLQNEIPGSRCLDLFAGSGACGIEALSRDCSYAVFIEQDRAAADSIRANLEKLDCDQAEVHCRDALTWLDTHAGHTGQHFDIVFVDPPYSLALLPTVMQKLANSGVLKNNARIYTESDQPLRELPKQLSILKEKKAGAVYYYLLGYSVASKDLAI